MATGAGIEGVGGPIRRLFGDGSASGMDAGELLRRFASDRDPVALEVLVARHGPMVLGVCRRVLGDRHASDDAFQATFLLLAKKAGAIRDPDRLGPWLHGVAHRVAVRARSDLARRNARERPGAEDLAMATPADEAGFDRLELRAALDEEVRRLPEKFRDPIVLCYLDGLTHDEAATRLRCPVGTVRSRLAAGRAKLRDRLARRGVEVPSGALAAAISAEAVPAIVSPVLLTSTVKAATAFAAGLTGATAAGVVPAAVASLAEGVSTTMILSKIKLTAGLALAGMMTVGVGGVAAYQAGGSGRESKAEKVEKPADDLISNLKAQLEAARINAQQKTAEVERAKEEVVKSYKKFREIEGSLNEAQGRLEPSTPKVTADQPAGNKLLHQISETTSDIQRLQEQRDKIRAELEAAQKRLVTLLHPEGLPAQPEPAFKDPFTAEMEVRVKQADAQAATAKTQLQEARDQLQAAQARIKDMEKKAAGTRTAGVGGGGGVFGGMGGGMMGGMGAGGGGGGGMGGAIGMGNNGGRGTGTGSKNLATLQSDECVIVQSPEGDKISGYSTSAGEWASYAIPQGVRVVPVLTSGVVALYAKGDQVGQVAAFAPASGKWYPIDLKEPASKDATPIVGPNQAVYTIGRRVYAFSAATESWDVLELPEGAKPLAVVYPSRAAVEHGDHIYIFSVKTGKWADFDAKAGRTAVPAAK